MGEIVRVRLFSDPEKEADIFIPRKCAWESLTSVITTRLGLRDTTSIQYLILCNRENYPLGDVVTDTDTFWGLFWHYRPEEDMAFLVRTDERVVRTVIESPPPVESNMFQKSLASLMESMDNQNQLWSRVGLPGLRDEEDDTTAETSNASSNEILGHHYSQSSSIMSSVSGISNDRMYDQSYGSDFLKFHHQSALPSAAPLVNVHQAIPQAQPAVYQSSDHASHSSTSPSRAYKSYLQSDIGSLSTTTSSHNDSTTTANASSVVVQPAHRPPMDEDEDALQREAEEQRRRAEALALQRLKQIESRMRSKAGEPVASYSHLAEKASPSNQIPSVTQTHPQPAPQFQSSMTQPLPSAPNISNVSYSVASRSGGTQSETYQNGDRLSSGSTQSSIAPKYSGEGSNNPYSKQTPTAVISTPHCLTSADVSHQKTLHQPDDVSSDSMGSRSNDSRPSSSTLVNPGPESKSNYPPTTPANVPLYSSLGGFVDSPQSPVADKRSVKLRLHAPPGRVPRESVVHVPPNCDWTDLTQSFARGLGLFSAKSLEDIVLLDEEGDETSCAITDEGKFWKFYLRRYRPQEGMVFLVRYSAAVEAQEEAAEEARLAQEAEVQRQRAEEQARERMRVLELRRSGAQEQPGPLGPLGQKGTSGRERNDERPSQQQQQQEDHYLKGGQTATSAGQAPVKCETVQTAQTPSRDEADRRVEALQHQRAEAKQRRAAADCDVTVEEEPPWVTSSVLTPFSIPITPPTTLVPALPPQPSLPAPVPGPANEPVVVAKEDKKVIIHCRLSSDPPPTYVAVAITAEAPWEVLSETLGVKFHLEDDYVVDKIALIDEDGDDVFGIIATAARFWKAYNARYRVDSMTFIVYVGLRPAGSHHPPPAAQQSHPAPPVALHQPASLPSTGTTSDLQGINESPEYSTPPISNIEPADNILHRQRAYQPPTQALVGQETPYADSLQHASTRNAFEPGALLHAAHTVSFQSRLDFSSTIAPVTINNSLDRYIPISSSLSTGSSNSSSPSMHSTEGRLQGSSHSQQSFGPPPAPPHTTMLPPVYSPNTQLPDPNQVANFLKACSDGDLMTTKHMISGGMDVNVRDPIGLTAMHVVCIMGRLELAQWLLQNGASYSIRDKEGMTPLHYACDNKHVQIALLLVRNGADSSLRNKAGITSLHIICIRGVMELTQLIRDYMINVATGSGLTLLHCAADQGHVALVKYLGAHGAQLHARDDDGMTPLHLACMAGHVDVCRLLIEMGAYWNARDDEGMSPLLYACQESHFELVLMLIDCSANIHARNNAGATALHLACEAGSLDIVAVLLERCLDHDVRRKDGSTPFQLAQKSGNSDLVQFLTGRGVKPLPPEQDMETALRVQVENKAEAAIRAFEAEEEANLQMELMNKASSSGSMSSK